MGMEVGFEQESRVPGLWLAGVRKKTSRGQTSSGQIKWGFKKTRRRVFGRFKYEYSWCNTRHSENFLLSSLNSFLHIALACMEARQADSCQNGWGKPLFSLWAQKHCHSWTDHPRDHPGTLECGDPWAEMDGWANGCCEGETKSLEALPLA